MNTRTKAFVFWAVLIAFGASMMAVAHAATVTVTDTAQAVGIFENNKSWSAHEFDNEGDGDLDLIINYHQRGSTLYLNDGTGHFTKLTGIFPGSPPLSGSRVPDRHDCNPADVDLNGLADFYCTTGRNQSNFVKPDYRDNELWLQTTVGKFTEVGTQLKLGDKCGRGRHVVWVDLAPKDGYPDLMFGNATGREVSDPCDNPANGYPNENAKLYRNLGNDPTTGAFLGFALVRDFGIDDPGQRGLEAFDCDLDGDMDVAANRLKNKTPLVFINGAGTLTQAPSTGLVTQTSDVMPYDMDSDGRVDLVQANRDKLFWQQNLGNCRFGTARTIAGNMTGDWHSVAIGVTAAGLTVYGVAIASSSNPTDYMFVQSGTTWTRYTVPTATGLGNEANAVHFGTDTQFLVLNGGDGGESNVLGPVQLIGLTVTP